jgi:hypothetical protein
MLSTFSPIDGLVETPPSVSQDSHVLPILVQGEVVGQEPTDPRLLDEDRAVLEVTPACPT